MSIEFSVPGLVLSLVMIVPNVLLVVAPPLEDLPREPRIPRVLTFLERAGQAGCLVLPAVAGGPRSGVGWLVVLAILVAGYYGLWARYLLTGRRLAALYAPLGPLPMPMAVLPVVAFGVAALWLESWLLAVATAVLAVGHLSTSWLNGSGVTDPPRIASVGSCRSSASRPSPPRLRRRASS